MLWVISRVGMLTWDILQQRIDGQHGDIQWPVITTALTRHNISNCCHGADAAVHQYRFGVFPLFARISRLVCPLTSVHACIQSKFDVHLVAVTRALGTVRVSGNVQIVAKLPADDMRA